MHFAHTENALATEIVDIAFHLHKQYGPGLFESVYEAIMCYELRKRGLPFSSQQGVPLVHDGLRLDIGFRADIIIENKVIIEIKSVDTLAPVHHKQVQTYLKLTGLKLALLINFNVAFIKEGIHRLVNRIEDD
jgi:GxxExxY protein